MIERDDLPELLRRGVPRMTNWSVFLMEFEKGPDILVVAGTIAEAMTHACDIAVEVAPPKRWTLADIIRVEQIHKSVYVAQAALDPRMEGARGGDDNGNREGS